MTSTLPVLALDDPCLKMKDKKNTQNKSLQNNEGHEIQ